MVMARRAAAHTAAELALLRQVPFLESLADSTLQQLLDHGTYCELSADTILFNEGDPGDALYIILQGEIEVLQVFDGALIHLTTLLPGEYVGEMALLDDSPRSATVRAARDSLLLAIFKKDLRDLAADYPALYNDTARMLSVRLREMNARRLSELMVKTQELEDANRRLRATYEETLGALCAALDLRDQVTQGHSQRVTAYTLLIAEALDVPIDQREKLRHGALLHDIGKIGVPDAILKKMGPLAPEEWVLMKKHPEMGAAIVDKIEFLRDAHDIVLSHHERYDGSGYPFGLHGEWIPLGARIFAIADVFDAVTTFRPYRMPMSQQEAVNLIRRGADREFDPLCVRAFEIVVPQIQEVMHSSFEE